MLSARRGLSTLGAFWGQLVSSVIWLVSATLGTWVTPKASILTVVIGGFFIFPLTQMLLRLPGRRASVSRENPFSLGAWIAGLALFAFAWIGRSIATGEASAPSTH